MPYRTDYMVPGPSGELERRTVVTSAPIRTADELRGVVGGDVMLPTPPAAAAPAAPTPVERIAEHRQAAERALTGAPIPSPERTFLSQLPSIGGAVTGGLTGARYGGMIAGPPGAVVGGLVGAAGGGFLGEEAQVGGERVLGAAPAEPGSALARGGRAAVRGAAGEVAGYPFRIAGAAAARAARPVAEAVEELGPVLRQELPASVKTVASAEGSVRRIGRLLGDPKQLAGFEAATPADQQTLLSAWWQRVAPKGRAKAVQAWDLLGEEGQQALAGPQRGAMQTVVDTLRAGGGGLDIQSLTRLGGVPALLSQVGVPPQVGIPIGIGLEASRRGVPLLFSPALTSPWGAPAFAVARPILQSRVPAAVGRTALQTGAAIAWPPPPPEEGG